MVLEMPEEALTSVFLSPIEIRLNFAVTWSGTK